MSRLERIWQLRVLSLLGVSMLIFGHGSVIAQQYCVPESFCGFGDLVDNVATAGAISNFSNLGSGCSANAYGDFTASHEVVVAPGSSFEVTVQSGPAFEQGFRIWIDWNGDGDFADPGEDVWNSGGTSRDPYTATILVPSDSPAGATRLRVRSNFNQVPPDPCGFQQWGETEDYSIIIASETIFHDRFESGPE